MNNDVLKDAATLLCRIWENLSYSEIVVDGSHHDVNLTLLGKRALLFAETVEWLGEVQSTALLQKPEEAAQCEGSKEES